MELKNVKQELNLRLSIKETLPIAKIEIEDLEEDEKVKKYISLKEYYKKYEQLLNQTEDEITDDIIKGEEIDLSSRDTYFCYGKDFPGYPKKIGGYYIREIHGPSLKSPIMLSYYRNIENDNDIVIIPSIEAKDFEEGHTIIYHITDNPEEEYRNLRRIRLRLKLKELDPVKVLKKERPKENE